MSIGLVMKYTYQETCEICDKIAQFTKSAAKKFLDICESIGYARAASYLASQGLHEQAKALMLDRNKKD